jgi:hypothetical protein
MGCYLLKTFNRKQREVPMDPGLVAAVMSAGRIHDSDRYAGCAMLSALPDAPVVDGRRRPPVQARWPDLRWRRRPRARAAAVSAVPTGRT